MKLITEGLRKSLPKLYSTEDQKDKLLRLKFFTPWTYWAWYLAEYDPDQRLAFGWVRGFEDEWGYFSMDELENLRGPCGLKVERDLNFEPIEFSRVGR